MLGYEFMKLLGEMDEEIVEDADEKGVGICRCRAVVGDAGRGLIAWGGKTDIEANAKEGAEAVLFLSAVGQGTGHLFSVDHDIVDGFDGAGGVDVRGNGVQNGAGGDVEELWQGFGGDGLGSFELDTEIDVSLSGAPNPLMLAMEA